MLRSSALLAGALYAFLSSAADPAPSCSLEGRGDFISDADYSSLVKPWLMSQVEFMCGFGCTQTEHCYSGVQLNDKTGIRLSFNWPLNTQGPSNCVSTFQIIIMQCLEGGQGGTPTAQGQTSVNNAYFEISFYPISPIPDPQNTPDDDSPDIGRPKDRGSDQPYTFFIADYLRTEAETGEAAGYGLLVHGAGKYDYCEAVAQNLDGYKAELGHPVPIPNGDLNHYRDFMSGLQQFELLGTRNGKVCNLQQTLYLSESKTAGRYVLGDNVRTWIGFCDLIKNPQSATCYTGEGDLGDDFKADYRKLLQCFVYGSSNYCTDFPGN